MHFLRIASWTCSRPDISQLQSLKIHRWAFLGKFKCQMFGRVVGRPSLVCVSNVSFASRPFSVVFFETWLWHFSLLLQPIRKAAGFHRKKQNKAETPSGCVMIYDLSFEMQPLEMTCQDEQEGIQFLVFLYFSCYYYYNFFNGSYSVVLHLDTPIVDLLSKRVTNLAGSREIRLMGWTRIPPTHATF